MIICEIGLNHLGNEDYAKQYIDEILKSKADAITFQILKDSLYKKERFKNFRLEKEFFIKASQKIKNGNKKFGVATDDCNMIDFLETLNVSFYKVLSKDINNFTLIGKLADSTNKKIYISTGMSDLKEIDLSFHYIEHIKERITFIHTQLTHDIRGVNLKAIGTLKNRFKLPVAFGLHCANHNVMYFSLAFEPSDIFMYVKGDREYIHPDEEHAILLGDIQNVINNLLELPQSIGEGRKLKIDNQIESNIL